MRTKIITLVILLFMVFTNTQLINAYDINTPIGVFNNDFNITYTVTSRNVDGVDVIVLSYEVDETHGVWQFRVPTISESRWFIDTSPTDTFTSYISFFDESDTLLYYSSLENLYNNEIRPNNPGGIFPLIYHDEISSEFNVKNVEIHIAVDTNDINYITLLYRTLTPRITQVQRTYIATYYSNQGIIEERLFSNTVPYFEPSSQGEWEFSHWYYQQSFEVYFLYYRQSFKESLWDNEGFRILAKQHYDSLVSTTQAFTNIDILWYQGDIELHAMYVTYVNGIPSYSGSGYLFDIDYRDNHNVKVPNNIVDVLSDIGLHNVAGYMLIFTVLTIIVIIALVSINLPPLVILISITLLYILFMFLGVFPLYIIIIMTTIIVLLFIIILKGKEV